ncbi:DNA modification methylase [Microbacterium sp. CJ88]|uniref:DNA modification methylase n=1 Tax=Microbacterium sp. CJ88 TaxID=3445672 RepID=UPI003F659780
MKSRLIASVALGAAVVLGATGCSMISPQATTIPYAPSDGINVNGTGPLKLRNVLIVATADGSAGNLVGAIVNESSSAQTLTIDIRNGAITDSVRVPANGTVSLGTADTDPLLLEGLDAKPGSDIAVYFSAGDQGNLATVPILDGKLDYLTNLVPTPRPTTSATPAASATPTPTTTP